MMVFVWFGVERGSGWAQTGSCRTVTDVQMMVKACKRRLEGQWGASSFPVGVPTINYGLV
jgi:hypothetical protein